MRDDAPTNTKTEALDAFRSQVQAWKEELRVLADSLAGVDEWTDGRKADFFQLWRDFVTRVSMTLGQYLDSESQPYYQILRETRYQPLRTSVVNSRYKAGALAEHLEICRKSPSRFTQPRTVLKLDNVMTLLGNVLVHLPEVDHGSTHEMTETAEDQTEAQGDKNRGTSPTHANQAPSTTPHLPPPPQQPDPSPYELTDFLADHFSLPELRELCLKVDIPSNRLDQSNTLSMAQEIVGYARRRETYGTLVAAVRELRPSAFPLSR